jgi:hypothetical protein
MRAASDGRSDQRIVQGRGTSSQTQSLAAKEMPTGLDDSLSFEAVRLGPKKRGTFQFVVFNYIKYIKYQLSLWSIDNYHLFHIDA